MTPLAGIDIERVEPAATMPFGLPKYLYVLIMLFFSCTKKTFERFDHAACVTVTQAKNTTLCLPAENS
jgi:hypothetical protein